MIRFGGRRWYWFWVPRRWPGKMKLLAFVTLALAIVLADRIFYVIPAGKVGVLFSPFFGGTRTDSVLHEGLQMVWPWKNVYVYDHRLQSRKFTMTALVESTMQVSIDIVVYYQLVEKNVPYIHKGVGENYAEMMIEPMVRSEVREVMGRISFEKVRDSDSSELERAVISQLNEAAGEQVVEEDGVMRQQALVDFKRIVLKSLSIPDAVSQAVNWKEQQQQYLLGADLLLQRAQIEARQRRVEAEGVAAANQLINASLTPGILTWRNIEALESLAKSGNSKLVVLGGSGKDMPVILGSDVFSALGGAAAKPGAPGSPPLGAEAAPLTDPKTIEQGRTPQATDLKPRGPVGVIPMHTDSDAWRHVPVDKAPGWGALPRPTGPNAAPGSPTSTGGK